MKQFSIILSAALILISSYTFAGGDKDGDSFTGTIKFKISAEGREITPTEQSQMPSEITEYHLGNMVRKDIVSPMYTISTITNNETKDVIMLFDLPMMGKKVYMKKSGKEIEDAKKEAKDSLDTESKVEILEGTKTIAGYTCSKAKLVNGDNSVTIYYTKDINAKSEEFEEIDGYPLYYVTSVPQDEELELVYSATEVITKKPKKKMFSIPSDFTEMTAEEKKMFGM